MRTEILNHPLQFLILMRFHKPIGILLLLWPTLWALWIAAKGVPPIHILLIFISGVTLMRAAGCIINDIADRNFDHQVERTKTRPLTSGKLSLRATFILFASLYALAFLLVCQLNVLSIYLALIGAAITALYPFMKRFTHWPQFILGIAFSWGILMAFAAVTGSVPPIAWLLFSTNLLWTITYDTQYAMTDREDDLRIGIKSTAILFGKYNVLFIGIFQVVILAMLTTMGILLSLSWPYYVCLALSAVFFILHQYWLNQQTKEAYFKAFLNNNWFGFMIFFGLFINYIA